MDYMKNVESQAMDPSSSILYPNSQSTVNPDRMMKDLKSVAFFGLSI